MKLKISDIILKSEGMLIREAIESRYASIEEFAEVSKIITYTTTMRTYLRGRQVKSQTFVRRIAQLLDMEVKDLIPNHASQISRYVDLVWDNIKEYRETEDLEVLEHLKKLCADHKLALDKARMNRLIGLHNFYRAQYTMALNLLEIALSVFQDRYESKLALICSSDMALVYNYQCRYRKALEKCWEVEEMLPKVEEMDELTFFLHKYRWGIILNNLGEYAEAKEKFEIALGVAPSDFDRANAIMHIGLVFKNQRKNADALMYYDKALELYDPCDYEYISAAYNNIAEVYRVKKDYDTALCILDKAMALLEGKDIPDSYIVFQTYVQVKAAKGETDIALNKLLNMTVKMQGLFICKKFFLVGIDTILKYCGDQKELLDELEQVLVDTIRGNEDDEFVWELKAFLGEVVWRKLR